MGQLCHHTRVCISICIASSALPMLYALFAAICPMRVMVRESIHAFRARIPEEAWSAHAQRGVANWLPRAMPMAGRAVSRTYTACKQRRSPG